MFILCRWVIMVIISKSFKGIFGRITAWIKGTTATWLWEWCQCCEENWCCLVHKRIPQTVPVWKDNLIKKSHLFVHFSSVVIIKQTGRKDRVLWICTHNKLYDVCMSVGSRQLLLVISLLLLMLLLMIIIIIQRKSWAWQ